MSALERTLLAKKLAERRLDRVTIELEVDRISWESYLRYYFKSNREATEKTGIGYFSFKVKKK